MSIRFLNCASMSPWWPRWEVGAICLLVDTDQGPVLVDTGLGLHDHEAPSALMRFFRPLFGILHRPGECALRQVEQLGIRPEDIRHIVLTHLHFDHAGGLPDFPRAKVHVHRREVETLKHPRTWMEMFAHNSADFSHHPEWVLYETPTETWMGFEAIRLPFSPRMVLVPLFGHTSGHCGVAIEEAGGWVFQAADAAPLNVQYDLAPDWLIRFILGPHSARLQALKAAHPEVRLLSGHTWRSFFNKPG